MNSISLLTTVAIFALPLHAFAHDAWVQPGTGPRYAILYGHKNAEPYSAEKIKTVQAFDERQMPIAHEVEKTKDGASLLAKKKPAMFSLFFDNGYWVKLGGESKNVSKANEPAGTDGSHPLKYSKTILKWTSHSFKPLGQRIEIVPVNFAQPPRAGSQMTVLVLLDGKPLPGMMIENNSDEKGPRTDAQGKATVTLGRGIQRLATDHDIPLQNDPNADRLSLTAALVFMAR